LVAVATATELKGAAVLGAVVMEAATSVATEAETAEEPKGAATSVMEAVASSVVTEAEAAGVREALAVPAETGSVTSAREAD